MVRSLVWSAMVLALWAAGCLPSAKVQWSPDGRRAFVMATDGLRLTDPDGKLSAPIAGTDGNRLNDVAWTPDSKQLVVIRAAGLGTWKEAKAFLDEAEVRDVTARAALLRQEILAYDGPADQFKPLSLEGRSGSQIMLVAMYLRDEKLEGIAEKLAALWKTDLSGINVTLWQIEVGDVAEGTVTFHPPLVRTLNALQTLRLSPDGRFVACVGEPVVGPANDLSLWIAPLKEDTTLRLVAGHVAMYPDWTADSQSVVYGHTDVPSSQSNSHLGLGTIARSKVRGAEGVTVKDPSGDGQERHLPSDADGVLPQFAAEDLVGLLFTSRLKVRCAAGGRLYYDSATMHLPGTTADLSPKPELFVIMESGGLLLTGRAVTQPSVETVSDGVQWFETSPDGKRVLLQTEQGLSIVSLDSGRVETTLAETQHRLPMLPVWRGNDEVCLAVAAESKLGSPKRPEVILWSARETKILSQSWPDKVVTDLLSGKQGETPAPTSTSTPTSTASPTAPQTPAATATIPAAATPSATGSAK
jgi:hypothetical protein